MKTLFWQGYEKWIVEGKWDKLGDITKVQVKDDLDQSGDTGDKEKMKNTFGKQNRKWTGCRERKRS